MDLNQATQMINWLEEERRKDKAALSALQERAQGLATDMAEQSKRTQELQASLASTQLSLTKMGQFDRLFEQFKADLIAEMERRDDAHSKALRETERLRKVDADLVNRGITEVRKELLRFKPLEDEMPMRRAEERRLGEILARVSQRVDDLTVRTEDRVQTVVFLEEGRRQDTKRISQLEEGSNNFVKRLDVLVSKLTLLEENLQRMHPRIEEVIKRMQEQDKTFEEIHLSDFRRGQEMKAFVEEINKAIGPISDHIATFQADYQKMREQAMNNQRALDGLQTFQARLETRQAEIAEMQRLGEERVKKQVEEWQGAEEKRWKRQTLVWLEQWQEHDRLHGTWEARLETVEQAVAEHARQLRVVWDGIEEFSKVYLAGARQVVEAQQAMLDKGRPPRPTVRGDGRVVPSGKQEA
jgi:DNA repair exonuclease SbcCD ATPase subunit